MRQRGHHKSASSKFILEGFCQVRGIRALSNTTSQFIRKHNKRHQLDLKQEKVRKRQEDRSSLRLGSLVYRTVSKGDSSGSQKRKMRQVFQ